MATAAQQQLAESQGRYMAARTEEDRPLDRDDAEHSPLMLLVEPGQLLPGFQNLSALSQLSNL